ncbi:MAG: hypothetical protein EP329_01410 [Deltaproteobacteria bacterium]|nr:MAG: hypothetical protein EP329_01410 [Deltaproteobacteria bacterium]
MPFDFLRRTFLERFFSRDASTPQQAPRTQTPAQGQTLAEQEATLRPGAQPTVQGPTQTPVRPEWQAFLNPVATPTQADLQGANQAAPGQTPGQAGQAQAQQPPASLVEEVRKKGLLGEFEAMWKAHPHNNGSANDQSAGEVNQAQGWDPGQWANTCALRISVMLNTLGGEHKITKDKAVAAGIPKGRVFYSAKTKWYYLLAASEIAQYVAHHQGKPSAVWPVSGRYKDANAFEKDFKDKVEPVVSGKKGFVFFDKIFGYSGSGHVDLFEGTTLSAAHHWYPSQALKVWYV